MSALFAIGTPLVAVAVMNLCLGLFLLARGNRSEPLTRYAFAAASINAIYCMAAGLSYIRASFGLDYELWYRATWIGWLAFAPLVQMLLCLAQNRHHREWGWVLYAVWGLILVLSMTTDLVAIAPESLLPFVARSGPLDLAARLLGALTIIAALYEMTRIHRKSEGRQRQQIGHLLFGIALYSLAALLFAIVFAILGLGFDPALCGYFSLGWMGMTAYAITRHRLFDVRFLVLRSAETVILAVLFGALSAFLFVWIHQILGQGAAAVAISVGGAVLLVLSPLRTVVHRTLSTVIMRNHVDVQQALKRSTRVLATQLTESSVERELIGLSRSIIGIESAALLKRSGDAFTIAAAEGMPDIALSLSPTDALPTWLLDGREVFVRDEQERILAPEQFALIDGSLRPFDAELAVALRYQGSLTGILLLGRKRDKDAFLQADIDVLETLAASAAIALANAELLDEQREAVRVRDDFLSVAGHELRTPLMALQINVQGVLRCELPEKARHRIIATQRQIARLTRLTDELLDVSRITSHQILLERETFDLCDLLDEVSARFTEGALRGGGLKVQLERPLIGSWDRLRLEQVVSNLLSNALKYGERQAVVLRAQRDSHGRAVVAVQDHGIGIAPEDQRRIFDRFERAVTQQHFGGFGLGLWISRQVVEAHQGRIFVSSERGAGAIFTVELPLASVVETEAYLLQVRRLGRNPTSDWSQESSSPG